MEKKPTYNWNEKTGVAECIYYYKNHSFHGYAHCNPIDEDMKSEYTGMIIADARAQIEVIRFIRDTETIPALAALKQFKYTINQSNIFNLNSYEYKMLERQIRIKEEELSNIRINIIEIKKYIKDYIDEKDKLYEKLRNKRSQGKTE